MSIKVTKFNPVNSMESDQEIVDFLIDCYLDDDTPDERIFQKAMEFVLEAKGVKGLLCIHRAYKVLIKKSESNPNWRQDEQIVASAA